MKDRKQIIGKYGEKIAKHYLLKNGYTILGSNLKLSFYELDIITKKDGIYIFVEVKTQLASNNVPPELSLNQKQINNLKRGILLYCQKHNTPLASSRLDCIAIHLNKLLKTAK